MTIVLASSNAFFKIGPLQFAAAAPTFRPGEPMSLTNHVTGQESLLLRAPTKSGSSFLLNPSFLIPTAAFLATGDVASGVIDPSLPKLIPVVAVASLMLGTAVNNVVLPQLKKVVIFEICGLNYAQLFCCVFILLVVICGNWKKLMYSDFILFMQY